MDKNTICNMALGLIKDSSIIDINEDSPRANACRLYFDSCAFTALAYHDFCFARKLCKPNLLAKNYDGFEYTYIYPSDAIAIRQYLDEAGNKIEVRGSKNIISDNNAMELLLTNQKISSIVYTARMLNTELWSDEFIEAFTYLLASKVISKVTGNKDHNEKYQLYDRAIEKAKIADVRKDSKTYEIDFYKDYKSPFSGKGF